MIWGLHSSTCEEALGLPHLLHDQLVPLLAHQAAGQAEEQAVGHKLGAFI